MTIETILMKRKALYKGEAGLFAQNPMAEEDFAVLTLGEEVVCTITSPKNLEALKFLWALVNKVANNSDRWIDKNEAMDDLKLRARYAKLVLNPTTHELEARPKSLKRISNEDLRLLTDKIIEIVCREIIPKLKPNDLRKEIEEMVGAS